MPVVQTCDLIALAEYWDELDAFDWGFQWSDDNAVYEAGRRRLEILRRRASLSSAHDDMFRGFEEHAHARNYLLSVVPAKPARPATS